MTHTAYRGQEAYKRRVVRGLPSLARSLPPPVIVYTMVAPRFRSLVGLASVLLPFASQSAFAFDITANDNVRVPIYPRSFLLC